MKALVSVVLILGLAVPCVALAQAPGSPAPPSPLSFPAPHPSMPWFGPAFPGRADYGVVPNRAPLAQDVRLYGTVIGYVEVPPQPVVINVFVAGPGSFSGEYQQQLVEIPGYFVTETTTGYLYPERWSLEQTSAGVFQWRVLPPLFTRK